MNPAAVGQHHGRVFPQIQESHVSLRPHQRDVGPVEGGQVLVVEARPLAELVVPWLERRCGIGILDDGVDPGPDLFHLLEVSQLHQLCGVIHHFAGFHLLARQQKDVADDVRPAVLHQVFLGEPPGHQGVEVVHPVLLPAGLKVLSPLRVRRTVVANIDGRRCALEDEQLLGGLAQMRHALNGRGTGANDRDALVLQAGQAPVRIATRVGVIPTAGMEAVALETLDAGNTWQLRSV